MSLVNGHASHNSAETTPRKKTSKSPKSAKRSPEHRLNGASAKKRARLSDTPESHEIITIRDSSDEEEEDIRARLMLPKANTHEEVKQESSPQRQGLVIPTAAQHSFKPVKRMKASTVVPHGTPHAADAPQPEELAPEDGLVYIPNDALMRWPRNQSVMARQLDAFFSAYDALDAQSEPVAPSQSGAPEIVSAELAQDVEDDSEIEFISEVIVASSKRETGDLAAPEVKVIRKNSSPPNETATKEGDSSPTLKVTHNSSNVSPILPAEPILPQVATSTPNEEALKSLQDSVPQVVPSSDKRPPISSPIPQKESFAMDASIIENGMDLDQLIESWHEPSIEQHNKPLTSDDFQEWLADHAMADAEPLLPSNAGTDNQTKETSHEVLVIPQASSNRSRMRLPFLARSLVPPLPRDWFGKFTQVLDHLRENGIRLPQRSLASLDTQSAVDETPMFMWTFAKCAHIARRKRVKFDRIKCAWCVRLHFTTVGALVAHVHAEHDQFDCTVKRKLEGNEVQIKITPKGYLDPTTPRKKAHAVENAHSSEVRPYQFKIKLKQNSLIPAADEPFSFSSLAFQLAKSTIQDPEHDLPPVVFKQGKTYKLRPDAAQRRRKVTVPKDRLFLSTIDMLPLNPGEVISDSEDDDGHRFQWESQWHQAKLLDNPDVDHNDTYVQQLWHVTVKAYGVDYVSHIFEAAARMIAVHAHDIHRHNARSSLVHHFVSLARLRTLTSSQVAELLKKYDARVANRTHERSSTAGSIGFGSKQ